MTPLLYEQGKLLHWLVLEPHKIDKPCTLWMPLLKTQTVYKEALWQNTVRFTYRKERQEAERLADALLRNEEALKTN